MSERFLQTYNEDYINGIKFLLNKSKEKNINIRKCGWIPHASKLLSEHNLCYKFWYNTWRQGYLNRVFKCKTWFDIMYGNEDDIYETILFHWAETKEGDVFWQSNFNKMLGVSSFYDSKILKESFL